MDPGDDIAIQLADLKAKYADFLDPEVVDCFIDETFYDTCECDMSRTVDHLELMFPGAPESDSTVAAPIIAVAQITEDSTPGICSAVNLGGASEEETMRLWGHLEEAFCLPCPELARLVSYDRCADYLSCASGNFDRAVTGFKRAALVQQCTQLCELVRASGGHIPAPALGSAGGGADLLDDLLRHCAEDIALVLSAPVPADVTAADCRTPGNAEKRVKQKKGRSRGAHSRPAAAPAPVILAAALSAAEQLPADYVLSWPRVETARRLCAALEQCQYCVAGAAAQLVAGGTVLLTTAAGTERAEPALSPVALLDGSYRDAASRPAVAAWVEQPQRGCARSEAAPAGECAGPATVVVGAAAGTASHLHVRVIEEYDMLRARLQLCQAALRQLHCTVGAAKTQQQALQEQLRARLARLHDAFIVAKLLTANAGRGHERYARFDCGLGGAAAAGDGLLQAVWRSYLDWRPHTELWCRSGAADAVAVADADAPEGGAEEWASGWDWEGLEAGFVPVARRGGRGASPDTAGSVEGEQEQEAPSFRFYGFRQEALGATGGVAAGDNCLDLHGFNRSHVQVLLREVLRCCRGSGQAANATSACPTLRPPAPVAVHFIVGLGVHSSGGARAGEPPTLSRVVQTELREAGVQFAVDPASGTIRALL
jgi:hypothetical protein